MSDKLFTTLGIVLFTLIAFPPILILAVSVGAAGGWIISGIFPSVTDKLCVLFGLDHAYQVGALLSFVGAFFKASINGVSK